MSAWNTIAAASSANDCNAIGVKHEAEAERMNRRPAEHGGERDRARRRMHAAQREHHADRDGDGERGRNDRVGDPGRAGDADRRRNEVAADDRPRLRQRACGDREQQHGGSAHRCDEQRQVRRRPEQQMHRPAGERNADERAEA